LVAHSHPIVLLTRIAPAFGLDGRPAYVENRWRFSGLFDSRSKSGGAPHLLVLVLSRIAASIFRLGLALVSVLTQTLLDTNLRPL